MYLLLKIVYFSIYNILVTLKSPLFWVVVLMILFQYRKIGKMEKEILGGYKKSPFLNTFISVFYGLLGGMLGSIVVIYLDVYIDQKDFLFVFPLALLLSLIHPRFICFSYAGGIISLISLIFGWPNVDVSSIMFIVGILHLVESVLILLDGNNNRIPIFTERNGRIVGGFTMNRFWPVPLVIFINNGFIYPITIFAILGYSDFALSDYPEKKSRRTASLLFLFSIFLIAFAKMSVGYYMYKYIAAIFSPLAHEIIILLGRIKEEKGKCIFTSSNRGLRILDTLPNSIGEKAGFNPGDLLLSINGKRVSTKKDIEEILYYRPKSICANVFDINKGFISREYSNCGSGIKSLGLIVVSDVSDYAFIVEESESAFRKILKRFKQKKSSFRN